MTERMQMEEDIRDRKKFPWKKVLIAAAIVIIIGVGLFFYTKYIENRTKELVLLENQDKVNLKSEILQYLTVEHTSDEIEKYLLEEFPKLSIEDCTSIVDTYIEATYHTAMQYSLTDEQTNELFYSMTQDRDFELGMISDEAFRDTLVSLYSQHIIPRYVNGELFIDVDYGYFADTFKDYLLPDYYEMLKLYDEEKSVDYQNEAGDKLYTDVVEKRLDTIYDLLNRYPVSEIKDLFEDYYYFYKSVYLGAYAQDYVFDDTAKIRTEVLDAYRSYVNKCKDPEFKEFLNGIIADYEEADFARTVPIYEKIKDFCGFYYETEETVDSETVTDE